MEFVWVVPRRALFPSATPHGLLPLAAAELEQRFLRPAREEGFFVERRYAEEHPEFKQPIPYVALCHEDQVLCLTRLKTQGESRLHGKRSIGVGGHINPCDLPQEAQQPDLFRNACLRELHEELVLPEQAGQFLEPVGLLNDDTTAVGAVHVGLVYRLDASTLDRAVLSIRECSAMTGGFTPLSELEQLAQSASPPFETWSTLLLQAGVLRQGAATPVLS